MTPTAEAQANRRIQEFERKRGGDLRLARSAALPVVLTPDLLHLLRINFLLDVANPPDHTDEADLLLSPLCREIEDGLYEMLPEVRTILLRDLATQPDGAERIRDVATLLWEYTRRYAPWSARPGLERAQQLTALNFLDPEQAEAWLEQAASQAGADAPLEREWFVAMRGEVARGREVVRPAAQQPTTLHEMLTAYFSLGEFKDLCFDLGIDFETLPADTKGDKARELVAYCKRHGRLSEFIALGRNMRPHVDWDAVAETEEIRPLRVFLCHSSEDKSVVRDLYQRLRAEGVEPWLDEENLLPGQRWRDEIPKAIRTADVVLVCLSHSSVNRAGYMQKEIRLALDVVEEQPEGSFVIPVRLEEGLIPDRLSHLHCVNLFEQWGYERLMRALHYQAERLRRVIAPVSSNVKSERLEGRIGQRVTALHRFRQALHSGDDRQIVAAYDPALLDDYADISPGERQRLAQARKYSGDTPSLSLAQAVETVQQAITQAQQRGEEDLAEDLDDVVRSLEAALKAEQKGNTDRRIEKLHAAQARLANLTINQPSLQGLLQTLGKVT